MATKLSDENIYTQNLVRALKGIDRGASVYNALLYMSPNNLQSMSEMIEYILDQLDDDELSNHNCKECEIDKTKLDA